MAMLEDFNRMRNRLRAAVSANLPPGPGREQILTAFAYYACAAVHSRGIDWEEAVAQYIGAAHTQAAPEAESWHREASLLRRHLAGVHGTILDVGAGWGRLAGLYRELAALTVLVEPSELGVTLMQRAGLGEVVRARGEALPLAACSFPCVVVTWVLHHDGSRVDAPQILAEIARVSRPGARLLSVEPIDARFPADRWQGLLRTAGFAVDEVMPFLEMQSAASESKTHMLIAATLT